MDTVVVARVHDQGAAAFQLQVAFRVDRAAALGFIVRSLLAPGIIDHVFRIFLRGDVHAAGGEDLDGRILAVRDRGAGKLQDDLVVFAGFHDDLPFQVARKDVGPGRGDRIDAALLRERAVLRRQGEIPRRFLGRDVGIRDRIRDVGFGLRRGASGRNAC